uniref:Uncharacterized protein n=1 Tax=Branchiostoma floridae TaxID=7739 RepID=C3Y704_BRAFL|eukprot:XP_002608104.1 hypothetical protein BRAFLDRAFT_91418 [Branchiostoma floridae]
MDVDTIYTRETSHGQQSSTEKLTELYGAEGYDNESTFPVPSHQQGLETHSNIYGAETSHEEPSSASYDGGTEVCAESVRGGPTQTDECTDNSSIVPNDSGAYPTPQDISTNPLPCYNSEESEVQSPVTGDCPDDDTDSHMYHYIDKDDVRINNLQHTRNKYGGQSATTATNSTGLTESFTGDIVGLCANPTYGDIQQPTREDNTCAEDICGLSGRCKKASTRQRVFLTSLIFIAAASFCWLSTAIIMHRTENKEDTLTPSVMTTMSVWKAANRSSTKISATPVLLDKSPVPSSIRPVTSSSVLPTTTMTEHLRVTSQTSGSAAQTTNHDDLTTTALSEVIFTRTKQFPHTTKLSGFGSAKTEKQVFSTKKESYNGYVYVDSGKIVFGQRQFNSWGHILVAYPLTQRVDMFTSQGDFVRTVVKTPLPTRIAIGPRGHLVVTNIFDNTVTVFPPQTPFV